MTQVPRIAAALALVVLSATSAKGLDSQPAPAAPTLQQSLLRLAAEMPEPPAGALLFAGIGWWVLMRKHPPRRPGSQA